MQPKLRLDCFFVKNENENKKPLKVKIIGNGFTMWRKGERTNSSEVDGDEVVFPEPTSISRKLLQPLTEFWWKK